MTQREWLLLFAALEGAPDGLDPVRIQNGMFLFAMEAPAPVPGKYTFEPYDYGPMSADIYSDLDRLVADGLLAGEPVPSKQWSRYRATDTGLAAADEILQQARADGLLDAARELHALKRSVAASSFNELLDRVYADYPQYAVNSVFRRVS